MTVKKQLLLILISLSVLPVMIITTIHLLTSIPTIENLHLNRLNAITRTSAAAFNEIVGLHKDEVLMISSNIIFKDYIKSLEQNGKYSDKTISQQSLLSDYIKQYISSIVDFDDAVFLDADGIVTIAYNEANIGKDLSNTDYFVKAKNNYENNNVFSSKVHKSLIYQDNPDKNCLAIVQSFFSKDGAFLGALTAYVNTYIMAEFSRSISFGDTGLSFVIDSDNYILYHPEARFYDSYTTAPQLSNLFSRWQNNEIPSSGLINGIMDGKRRIYYYEVMSDIELILILRQDYDEFSVGRTSTMFYALISGAITVFLAIFLGIKLSKKFTQPIMMLKNAFSSADELGSYVICELPINNELGDMAKSYNSMITKLEKQYELVKVEKDKNEYIAKHDNLTGLLNRSALEQVLKEKLKDETSFGLFFVDLDKFKDINDIHGHSVGDSLLSMLGARILQSKVNFDICARIGGDEFILIKNGTRDEMKNYSEILITETSEPYLIGKLTLDCSASIGVSMYPQDAQTVDTLLKSADTAMYKAKNSGKKTFRIYTDKMRSV